MATNAEDVLVQILFRVISDIGKQVTTDIAELGKLDAAVRSIGIGATGTLALPAGQASQTAAATDALAKNAATANIAAGSVRELTAQNRLLQASEQGLKAPILATAAALAAAGKTYHMTNEERSSLLDLDSKQAATSAALNRARVSESQTAHEAALQAKADAEALTQRTLDEALAGREEARARLAQIAAIDEETTRVALLKAAIAEVSAAQQVNKSLGGSAVGIGLNADAALAAQSSVYNSALRDATASQHTASIQARADAEALTQRTRAEAAAGRELAATNLQVWRTQTDLAGAYRQTLIALEQVKAAQAEMAAGNVGIKGAGIDASLVAQAGTYNSALRTMRAEAALTETQLAGLGATAERQRVIWGDADAAARVASGGLNSWNAGILISRGNMALLLAAVGYEGLHQFADFTSQMQQFGGNTGTAAAQVKVLSADILDFDRTTSESMTEAVTGLRHASDEGYRLAAGIKVLDAANKGAIATGSDLGDTTNALAREMHNFNEPASQATRIMGQMLTASQYGNETLQQEVQSLAKLGPLMASVNQPFTHALALVSEFTKATGDPALASTWATNMIVHIVGPTKVAIGVMQELHKATGIDLERDFQSFANGGMTLEAVMRDVQRATGDNAKEVMALFGGIRGGVGALQYLTHGFDDYDRTLAHIRDGEKQLNDQAKAAQDTLSFKTGVALNVTKEAFIGLGAEINRDVGHLIDFVATAGKGHNVLTDMLIPAVQKFESLPAVGAVGNWLFGSTPQSNALQDQIGRANTLVDTLRAQVAVQGQDSMAGRELALVLQGLAKLHAQVAEKAQQHTERVTQQTIAYMNLAKAMESVHAVPVPNTGADYQAQFSQDSKDEITAAYKLVGDELNRNGMSMKAWTAELDKDRVSLASHQSKVEQETKLFQQAQAPLDAFNKSLKTSTDAYQSSQTALTAAEDAARSEYIRTGAILPSTRAEILRLTGSITGADKALAALTAKSDPLGTAQKNLTDLERVAAQEYWKTNQILPDTQDKLKSTSEKIANFQVALGKLVEKTNTAAQDIYQKFQGKLAGATEAASVELVKLHTITPQTAAKLTDLTTQANSFQTALQLATGQLTPWQNGLNTAQTNLQVLTDAFNADKVRLGDHAAATREAKKRMDAASDALLALTKAADRTSTALDNRAKHRQQQQDAAAGKNPFPYDPRQQDAMTYGGILSQSAYDTQQTNLANAAAQKAYALATQNYYAAGGSNPLSGPGSTGFDAAAAAMAGLRGTSTALPGAAGRAAFSAFTGTGLQPVPPSGMGGATVGDPSTISRAVTDGIIRGFATLGPNQALARADGGFGGLFGNAGSQGGMSGTMTSSMTTFFASAAQAIITPMVNDFNTRQQASAQVLQAGLAKQAAEQAVSNSLLQEQVTETADLTAIMQASSQVRVAQIDAQTAAITGQTSIFQAIAAATLADTQQQRAIDADVKSGNSAQEAADRAVLAAQKAVEQDNERLAQAQMAANVAAAQWQVRIAQDGVKTARDKMAVDQANFAASYQVLVDQRDIASAGYKLAEDQAKLSLDMLTVQTDIANALTGASTNPYAAMISGDLANIGSDQSGLDALNRQLATDQQSQQTTAIWGQQLLANDEQATAGDQGAANESTAQSNLLQAIYSQIKAGDEAQLAINQDTLNAIKQGNQDTLAAMQAELDIYKRALAMAQDPSLARTDVSGLPTAALFRRLGAIGSANP